MGSYTRRVLYPLMLTAIFTGVFLSFSFTTDERAWSIESEQKISDPLISGPLASSSLVSGSLSFSSLVSSSSSVSFGSLVSSGPLDSGSLTPSSLFSESALSNSVAFNAGSSILRTPEKQSENISKIGIEKEKEPQNKETKNKKKIEEIRGTDTEKEAEENLTAYVRFSPGTDAGILTFYSTVEEWDEASGLAAVCIKPGSIEELSSLNEVYSVQPAISPVIRKVDRGEKRVSSTSSKEFWMQDSITGKGIKIGIISDGVEDISEALAFGILPDDIHILSPGKGKEGTVMLEIVHEISPGAELYFHSAGGNKLEFNRAIDALIAEGCRIICDDVGWPDEPFFEDGVVASHIKEVIVNQDILYVSAAGNDAGRHYQGMFFDNGSGWHDFSSGTSTSKNICMDVPPGEKVTVVLQWNDPWSYSESDYDLYLYDCCNREQLAASEKIQSGTGTPLEYIQYTNMEETVVKVGVSIKKHSGIDRVLEVYIYQSPSVKINPENLVEEDSVFGHPAVPGVICVGAVDSGNPENKGIAYYSSRGPVSIYYPVYELRNKTDLSGPGSVRISGVNGTGRFFAGTSASAPSVAGIGALVWSVYPEKSNSEIREILCSSAEDLGTPGYDTIFGHGSVSYSTVRVLQSPSTGNNLLSEKSEISFAETASSVGLAGIFTLELAKTLEQIRSQAKPASQSK